MAVTKATEFDTMKVLHNLWSTNQITSVEVKSILKTQFDLELTVLANGEIKAQSTDGTQKYIINQ